MSGARRLILMRHAKSAWDAPQSRDRDRALARRGRLGASLMGAWLAELEREGGFEIDHGLISTSLRTRQTWERLQITLGRSVSATFDPALYLAEPSDLLAIVQGAPPTARTLLVMGHNDGIELFAAGLTPSDAAAATRFPTAAVAAFVAEDLGSWAEARFGGFRLLSFETPKSLV